MDKQTPKGEDVAASPIFKKFVGKAEEYIKKPTRMKQLLNDAYTKASDKKDVGSIAHEAWETLQTMLRLIRTSVSGEYTGLPTSSVVAAVAVTIYFLSPIDLIPDFIPVLGLLDDVALVAWFSTTIKEEMEKFMEWEKTRPSLVEDATVLSDDEPVRTATSASGHAHTASDAQTSATAYSDVASTTTDSSREPNAAAANRPEGGDAGGNVR